MIKKIGLLCLIILATVQLQAQWTNNFELAKTKAAATQKYILLNFSGSDWCIPCINFKKNVLQSACFKSFSDSLLLVNADFPQRKKNMPPPAVVKANEKLAELYNKEGSFPLTILFNPQGIIVQQWSGGGVDSKAFCQSIKQIIFSKK